MNETPLTPPPLPSSRPSTAPSPGDTPSPAQLDGVLGTTESLLRNPARIVQRARDGSTGRVLLHLGAILLPGALGYGLVVGAFSGGTQLWAAPLKVAAGLVLSGLICLPSLYIFGCLTGSTARLRDVLSLVSGLLALVTVLLLGFAPVAWVFSQSTQSLVAMGVVHLLFWMTASLFGLRFLSAGFRQLEGRSTGVLRLWMLLYLIVGLQMTTTLRPLIGTSDRFLPTEKRFFLSHWSHCLRAPETAETPRSP
ncbi:MAG TPA: hypothetical protein DCM86_12350 [Verrucomicrobiales bacterium]|nr:hypothetical protein [Verrucomicrobiales bacterium]